MKGTGVGNAVDRYGMEQVLNGYDTYCNDRENIYYSVWQGNVPKFFFDGGNNAAGKQLLEDNLGPLVMNCNSAMYTIKFHPAPVGDEELTNKSPITGSFNFKMVEPTFGASRQMNGVGNRSEELMLKMIEKIDELNTRVTDIEEAEPENIDTDEQAEEVIGKVIGNISRVEKAIMESPLLSQGYMIGQGLIKGLAKKWNIDLPGNVGFVNNKAMTPEEDKANFKTLVDRFPELPDMLRKLYNLSENDNISFEYVKKKLIEGIKQV